MATGKQHCVMLCAPDDTAVDDTLSELCFNILDVHSTVCTCSGFLCKCVSTCAGIFM